MGKMLMQFHQSWNQLLEIFCGKKLTIHCVCSSEIMWICIQIVRVCPYGTEQYFPHGTATIPENRLFAQFHAPQTSQMKDEIPKQLKHCSGNFCNSCFRNWCGHATYPPHCTYWTSNYSESLLTRNWERWQSFVGLLVL